MPTLNRETTATPAPRSGPVWYALTVDETLAELKTNHAGLSAQEARRRLDDVGPNELEAARRVSPWRLLLDQFKNVLIIILLVATGLSAFLGEGVETIVIGVIVLFAVGLGFIQEFRAERAIDALRKMAAPTATVWRDGEELEVPAQHLVPGDIVLLQAGDRVPADVRLVESFNLQIEESALTGESVAVEKHAAPMAGTETALGDRKNMAYAGTSATYGRGRAVVVATAMNTEFGKIARMLQSVQTERTPLQQNLDKVGHLLARVALVMVALIVGLGLLRGQPFMEMLIFGIALAVAVVPEALPAVVTISLAIGVQRMVKRHALMRRLPAVETLGCTSVICSDKTGTLTKDEMTVRNVYVAARLWNVSGAGYDPHGQFFVDGQATDPDEALQQFLRAATLASDAHSNRGEADGRWHIKGDATEGALVVAAAKAGLVKAELERQAPRSGEIPFTSETKRMTTLHSVPDGTVAFSKGAPEIILASCTHVQTRDNGALRDERLDDAGRQRIMETARSLADQALRVLGVARKSHAALETAEHGMTFLGLAGMIDPPRPEAREAVQKCEQAGIRVVMITGDHPVTAQAVARELGILKGGRVITGAQLDEISDTDFEREAAGIDVFARVSPAHKLRVISALQKGGSIVAMTGDGVNDAPALKKADIGIAMGITGTDVTKEAAAMTLTDDNFASIVAAVEEGRGIFSNIKKYLMFLLSSNIGEMLIMAGATVLGMPMPLSAVQILYINLATDGLPALALAVDPPERDLMRRPPRNPRAGIFSRPVVFLMTVGGVWSAIANLGLFAWARAQQFPMDECMTLVFVSLCLVEFFKAFSFRSDRHTVLRRPFANRWLNLAILWELLLLAGVVYLPFLHKPFGTFALPLSVWPVLLGVAVTIIPVLEAAKWAIRRGWVHAGK
ncbi:MAG: cation-translocating P-type ATPase [Lentisphaerae bacterium]|nr:cation-translocating P-type ATPase [Lentisphaerota bacterium]